MSRTLTKRLEYVEQYEVLVGIDLALLSGKNHIKADGM